ncbi:MAG: flagellar basal body-associated FliL family protein [Candidatus Sericytochromatia bacterium]|nr:flagellar basal body-associated FliL family protein [Candidatus Sericytochromatia bacterium]
MVARLRGRPTPSPPEEDQPSSKGSSSSSKSGAQRFLVTVTLISLLSAAGALGALIYFTLGPGRTPVTVSSELAPASTGPLMDLGPFIVNLGDVSERRYLRISMSLDFQTQDAQFVEGNEEQRRQWSSALKHELERLEPVFKDVVVTTLTVKQPQTLSTANGKEELKAELIARLNRHLPSRAAVQNIYLTDFVIQ